MEKKAKMVIEWSEQQKEAIRDHGKTLLVSAAAGSGKTAVLTERIIRKLTDSENPGDLSRMLIVTFTRASAADLKEKISKALTKKLGERPGDPHLTKQLLSLGNAQISTIDSFFQKAVRQNFDALDLPAAFRIADETEAFPICMNALSNLMEVHYAKSERPTNGNEQDPLARVNQNAFAEAMDHIMTGRSDGKTELLLLEFYDKFSSYPEGIGLLVHCARSLCEEATGEFFQSRAGDRIRTYLLGVFRSHLAYLTETLTRTESDPELHRKYYDTLTSDIDYCLAMLRALENGSYQEAFQAAPLYTPKKRPNTNASTPDYLLTYAEWRKKFKTFATESIFKYLHWTPEELPNQFYRTAAFCQTLFSFYSDYEAAVLKEKKARGILEYNDVRAALYRYLASPDGTPTPAAIAMSAQYDAVYIDEYQDVDFLQDAIFEKIGGSRRFMVGDIKQSIYVFRGSKPSVFSNYRRKFPLYNDPAAADAEGVCVFMSNNYRCNDPVIRFTNKVCSFLFSACEESIGYRKDDDLVFSKEKNPNDKPVQLAFFEPRPKAKRGAPREDEDSEDGNATEFTPEAAWVAREIERLCREERLDSGARITPADIAILVRTKASGVPIARALQALKIPVVAEAAEDLLTDPLTVDVLNLLRTVDNPYRDIPLSEFLLSSLGGFTLEEVTAIRESAPTCKALYDAMLVKAEEDSALGNRIALLCARIERLRELAATLPADKFLRRLYLDEPLVSYQGDPVLLYLYEQARTYQKTAFCGLYGFLDTLSKRQGSEKVSADGFKKPEKAVSIMTVHHSKGLEFPVVFLCGCGKAFRKDDLYKSVLFHSNVGCAPKLYNPETGESEESILHLAVGLEIDAEQVEEGIRTLYVALTRARERLYVSGTLRGSADSACMQADTVRRGDRASILGCGSYLAWILAALREKGGESAPYELKFYPYSPVPSLEPFEEVCEEAEVDEPNEEEAEAGEPLEKRYARLLLTKGKTPYPLAFLQGLPTKAAASKLSPDLLDRLAESKDADEFSEAQLELMMAKQPSFEELILSEKEPSSAAIGTATHAFLQFCSFSSLAETDVETECARLLAKGFLSTEQARIIDLNALEAFRKSALMEELLGAARIYREQKFNLFVPFGELTHNPDAPQELMEHSLFVQGSIDLLIETVDGELFLVDYKTDRIRRGEQSDPEAYRRRLCDAHRNQLTYYQRAVEELFGKRPEKTYLYSIPLGDWVELK